MLGIIGAMEEEVAILVDVLENAERETIAGLCFCRGRLDGGEVVIVKSGIGKVNAAACTQLLIYRYGVDRVVNTGIAGGLNSKIEIGDIVLSRDAVQHDMDATAFGYRPGEVPRMGTLAFQADGALLALAERLNREVNPDIATLTGRVASGDQFVSKQETKQRIREQFDADCCEMEGAAIAQVCAVNKVPFLIVRAISDKADESAVEDYPSFEKKAIAHCVKLTRALAAAL